MGSDLEAEIKGIYAYAQNYLDLINERNPSEPGEVNKKETPRASVRISIMAKQEKWPESHRFCGDVYPTVMAFDRKAMIMTRGYSGETLPVLIKNIRGELKKEYERFRDENRISCIGKCGEDG